jgi:EAL domain-containing protein (putative c-di-GMP-specific phosphodiesterase class I)
MHIGPIPPPEHSVERRALGHRERFVAFAFAAADTLIEVGADGRVSFATGATRTRFGEAPEAMVGRPVLDLVAAEDRNSFAAALALLPSRGRLPPTRFRLADAPRSAVSIAGLRLGPAPGTVLSLAIAALPAPAEMGQANAEALLTEARTRLGAAQPGRLGVIDLGPAAGPQQQAETRAALSGHLPGDALFAELAPGRYGLLAAPGAALPDLGEVGARLEAALGAPVATGAIGLDADGLSPSQAARALRHALAVFSRQGQDGLRSSGATKGLKTVLDEVTGRAAALRRAVEGRRFTLDYQPIMSLADRSLHHYEALLRPDRRLLAVGEGPQDFVLLAETVGLTAELDLAVLDTAIAATPQLADGQRIAVNLSGLSVQAGGFREQLLARLDAAPAAQARLMVELTESAEIEDEDSAQATLSALRARGVPVCLDDFGAGAAAFRYLKAFPVDYVKVDGSFVLAARSQDRDRSFVAAMVDLSLAVGARVVAERIETEEDAATMRQLGVHCGQGWLFGRPGPLPEIAPKPAAARRRGAREQWG